MISITKVLNDDGTVTTTVIDTIGLPRESITRTPRYCLSLRSDYEHSCCFFHEKPSAMVIDDVGIITDMLTDEEWDVTEFNPRS